MAHSVEWDNQEHDAYNLGDDTGEGNSVVGTIVTPAATTLRAEFLQLFQNVLCNGLLSRH